MNFNILDNVLTVSLALIREQGRAETFVVTHVSSTRGMSHLPLASHPTDVIDKKKVCASPVLSNRARPLSMRRFVKMIVNA